MPSGMIQSLCRACGQKYILKKEGSSTRLSFIFQGISALTFICYASAGGQYGSAFNNGSVMLAWLTS
jgi:hypothetical protein